MSGHDIGGAAARSIADFIGGKDSGQSGGAA